MKLTLICNVVLLENSYAIKDELMVNPNRMEPLQYRSVGARGPFTTNVRLVKHKTVKTVFMDVVLEVSGQEEECPENWWEEPVQRCYEDLVRFISADHAHLSANDRIDQTCTLWQQTRQCFRDLITICPEHAVDLQRRMMHHSHVSVPCYDDQLRYREILIDCYSHFIGPTRTCRGGFDKYYYEMVMNDEFSDACRVLAAVVKCLHGQKEQVAAECRPDGAVEYHRNYITPLLEQVSPNIKRRCKMKPPYDQYLGGAAACSASTWISSLLICILIIMH